MYWQRCVRLGREQSAQESGALELAGEHAPAVSIAHLQRTNPKEWARQFDDWVDSHDPNLPVLSDEAMSRNGIYPDHV